MNVEYTGRQTTVTKKLKVQAEAGLARIAKIVGNSGSVHVTLSSGQVPADCRDHGADETPEPGGDVRGDRDG